MRMSRIAIVFFVLLIFSIYVTGTEAAKPVWKERQTVSVTFKIIEGDQVVSVPTIRILSNSGQEAKVSIGANILVGDREQIGEQMIGYEASIVANSVGDGSFHITWHVDFNELAQDKPETLSVNRRSSQGSCIAKVEKEYEYTMMDSDTKQRSGTKLSITLAEIESVGWVNLTPVSVAGKSLSVESILQTICKQARLKLGIERMDAKTKEKIQRKTMVSLTDVPFDRALKALGEHCEFTAFYFKEEGVCHVRLPK